MGELDSLGPGSLWNLNAFTAWTLFKPRWGMPVLKSECLSARASNFTGSPQLINQKNASVPKIGSMVTDPNSTNANSSRAGL
jgi:hypothetical protein